MQTNIVSLRAIGSELLFTVILCNLALAHLEVGQVDEGLAAVDDGLQCVERDGERWAEAELHRFRGELLLACGSYHSSEAEACFGKALQIARRQDAKAYELRAAESLARLGAGGARLTSAS